MSADEIYMARAIEIAKNGRYTTDPNPQVGCVLVRGGKIIAEGWHFMAGNEHAEIMALDKIADAAGATAYTSLEPCSHTGRTAPCCDALIASGVRRLVVAMQDPNPQVAGSGIAKIRRAGVEVVCGVLQREAAALNPGFIKRMTCGAPLVISKQAISLDGRTATQNGQSKWISGEKSRADVQKLRASSSAILTGIGTVLADDPSLNARLDDKVLQPIRVVLDSTLQMPATAKMLALPGETWILTRATNAQKTAQLEQAGGKVFAIPNCGKRLDLAAVLQFLGQKQINTVLVEAGATLNAALFAQNLIDQHWIYMATCLLGDSKHGLYRLPAIANMADKKLLHLQSVKQIGNDLRLILQP